MSFVLGKRNKGGRGGGGADDQLDGGSDADSVTSMSTALSDLQLAQATEHVSSQEFVLDKYIDALYEKRWVPGCSYTPIPNLAPWCCYACLLVSVSSVWASS